MVDVTGGYPSATNVGNVIRVPDPTRALITPAPNPASAIKSIWATTTTAHYRLVTAAPAVVTHLTGCGPTLLGLASGGRGFGAALHAAAELDRRGIGEGAEVQHGVVGRLDAVGDPHRVEHDGVAPVLPLGLESGDLEVPDGHRLGAVPRSRRIVGRVVRPG